MCYDLMRSFGSPKRSSQESCLWPICSSEQHYRYETVYTYVRKCSDMLISFGLQRNKSYSVYKNSIERISKNPEKFLTPNALVDQTQFSYYRGKTALLNDKLEEVSSSSAAMCSRKNHPLSLLPFRWTSI